MSVLYPPKIFLFDTIGTVVDWRITISTIFETEAKKEIDPAIASRFVPSEVCDRVYDIRWIEFAEDWRGEFMKFCTNRDNPSPTVVTVEHNFHSSLIMLLDKNHLTGLWSDTKVFSLSIIWHHLPAWIGSKTGLEKLAENFTVGALSNGTTALLNNIKLHNGFSWSRTYSSETFNAHMPAPPAYRAVALDLGVEPHECALVCARLADLEVAKECGFQTVYLQREGEETMTPHEFHESLGRKLFLDMYIGKSEKEAGGGILEIAKRFERVRGG